MIEGRSKAALSRFFIEQGPRWCHSVNTVSLYTCLCEVDFLLLWLV